MGGHYGSVQVRTEDREAVWRAAEAVAREREIKCLVGPALGGWVGVYAEQNGQDESVGEAIAGRVGGAALHLLVHDDDVLAYWLWRDGQLVDSFYSRPGYFGEQNRAAEEAMAGRAEVLAEVAGGSAERLRELLRRDDAGGYTFEVERLEELARALEIRNAVTAYEYLKDGETEGVTGWRQFVEVPADAVADEKAARQAERKRVAAETKRLKGEGLLLAEEFRREAIARACAAGDGFLVAWYGHRPDSKRPDGYWYRPPWREPAALPAGVQTAPAVLDMGAGAAGARVAVARGSGVAVYDARDWTRVGEVVEEDVAQPVALSADGSRVAHESGGEVVVSEVATGRRLAVAALRGAGGLAIHPSGRWAVTGVWGVATLDVETDTLGRERLIGGRSALAAAVASRVQDWLANVDVDEILRAERAAWEAGIARAIEMLERNKRSNVTDEQIAAMHQNMEVQFGRRKDQLLRAKSGQAAPQVQGNERPGTLYFSPDGERLWCATDHGIRGYGWKAVLGASGDEDMPEPRWRFDPPKTDPNLPQFAHVYAVAEEPEGAGVLFGADGGKVYRMDLASGEVRTVLTTPQGGAVIHLSFSADGSALGVILNLGIPYRPGERQNPGCVWQVWSRRAVSRGVLERTGSKRNEDVC